MSEMPDLEHIRLLYALSKDTKPGRPVEAWWAIRDAAEAEFDRAIAKIKAEAKAEALREAAGGFDYEAWNTTYAAMQEDPDANIDRVGVPVEWLRARADKLDPS